MAKTQLDWFRIAATAGIVAAIGGLLLALWTDADIGMQIAATGVAVFLGASLCRLVWSR